MLLLRRPLLLLFSAVLLCAAAVDGRGADSRAKALQKAISAAAAEKKSGKHFALHGDYDFGNETLLIDGADGFTIDGGNVSACVRMCVCVCVCVCARMENRAALFHPFVLSAPFPSLGLFTLPLPWAPRCLHFSHMTPTHPPPSRRRRCGLTFSAASALSTATAPRSPTSPSTPRPRWPRAPSSPSTPRRSPSGWWPTLTRACCCPTRRCRTTASSAGRTTAASRLSCGTRTRAP